jgi:uncharacterized protein (DUF488 family)
MYYRRKVLLGFLEVFGGSLGKINLQKLLFLLSKNQSTPSFDFVPHKYGCYSFQANWDMTILASQGYVEEKNKTWHLKNQSNFFKELKKEDSLRLMYIFERYQNYSAKELMIETYQKYPYFAIRSEIASELLNREEYKQIEEIKPKGNDFTIFTIGYEGQSIESYFNKLINNNVKVLCDVRRNAFSQKAGFSKHHLKFFCEVLGIEYMHIPELGIESGKRQALHSQSDYNSLFQDYEENYLIYQEKSIEKILHILESKRRIALTCFEKSYCQCHRSKVAEALVKSSEQFFELKHL